MAFSRLLVLLDVEDYLYSFHAKYFKRPHGCQDDGE